MLKRVVMTSKAGVQQDISDYVIAFNVDDALETISSATVGLSKKALTNLDSLVLIGSKIDIWGGKGNSGTPVDDHLFGGRVINKRKNGISLALECKGLGDQMLRKEVTKSFIKLKPPVLDGNLMGIAKYLIDTYCTDLSSTGVVYSSDTINRLPVNREFVYNVIDKIREIPGWQMYVDPDGIVHIEPAGYMTETKVLEVGVNCSTLGDWTEMGERLLNNICVVGGNQTLQKEEYFSGDGTTAEFQLTYVPKDVQVWVYNGAAWIEKKGGQEYAETNYHYTVIPDKEYRKVIFVSSAIPASGTDNVKVLYSYDVPLVVSFINDQSVDDYFESGQTFYKPEYKSRDDIKNYIVKLSERQGVPPISGRLKVSRDLDFQLGSKIRVIDAESNIDRWLVVNSLTYSYPDFTTEIGLGDESLRIYEELSDHEDRIGALEGEVQGTDTLLTVIKQISSFATIDVNIKEQTVYRERIYDSFILGHSENGVLNQGQILDALDAVGNWTASGTTLSLNTDEDYFQQGEGSLKVAWSSVGAKQVSNTTDSFDISSEAGESSGTPSKGTAAFWIYLTNATDISALKLRIGSDSSNYCEYVVSSMYQTGGALVAGWNYVRFDLDDPDSVEGTPDWTSADYHLITFTAAVASGELYIDYYTVSKSNSIGLNGIGRRTVRETIWTQSY